MQQKLDYFMKMLVEASQLYTTRKELEIFDFQVKLMESIKVHVTVILYHESWASK